MSDRLNEESSSAADLLKVREQQLSLIYDNVSDVIFALSITDDGRFQFSSVNQRFLHATGLSEQAVIGKYVEEVLPPSAHGLVIVKYREAIRLRKAVSWEEVSEYPSGRKIGEVTVAPVIDASGACRQLIGTVHDVTEYRQMHALLEKAEERWRLALEGSGAGVWDWDVKSNAVSYSAQWTRLLGYQEGDIAATAREWESRIHPEDRAQVAAAIADAVSQHRSTLVNEHRLLHANGHWLWVHGHGTISYDRVGKPERMIGTIVDITERKAAEDVIWRQANFDPLTSLPNRFMFSDQLTHAIELGRGKDAAIALLFIDLDRFKEVNDGLGHGLGDKLLLQVAERLQQHIREADTIARLGGDEFAVVLSNPGDGLVERVARTIIQVLSDPFDLDGHIAHVSASVGIACYPRDAAHTENLIKHADQAMYAAKREGGNRHGYFLAAMQHSALTRRRLINNLHGAIAGNQLQVHYQPIVDLSDGSVTKAEALLRWRHPVEGNIGPDVFIPLAEEIGFIERLSDWVCREALHELAPRCRAQAFGFQVSINFSPTQFKSGKDGFHALFELIDQIDLSPQCIVVEITEGVLLNLDDRMLRKFDMLAERGIQLALDDFGTGYSSLSYITKLKFNFLKIDKVFIQDLESNAVNLALCETMIAMAHKLGIKVIAEGIETETQKNLLAKAGCDYGQGYVFARPMPFDALDGYLNAMQSRRR